MKLIFGLGNPGEKYKNTRHNAGFLAVDFLIHNFGFSLTNFYKKFNSDVLESQSLGDKVLFVKPQTFMNESGKAVREITQFYKLDFSKDILVLHDDADLPLGTIRFTASSSSAGQNGVQNIIDELGSQDFPRLRIGVESRVSREEMETANFVLSNFSAEEMGKLEKDVFPEVEKQVQKFLEIT